MFSLRDDEKERALLPILRELCPRLARECPPYGRFLARLGGPPPSWETLAQIPPLPVAMFKRFALRAVAEEAVVRELRSSGTTGQTPSVLAVDKATAFRQAKALAAVLKERIGAARRPYLVLDAPEAVGPGDTLTARGAAIRGIGSFATETVFGLRRTGPGDLEPDLDAAGAFLEAHREEPVLVFGFTYMVWTRFVLEAERRGVAFHATQAILLHSGGWKKLSDKAVSKETFTDRASRVLGCPRTSIIDFYGMVEQAGSIFLDCEAGNKHAPAFAHVIVRAPDSLRPARTGEPGILEVVSVLPTSYPGNVLLTEDMGVVVATDDCPCGRKGSAFRFLSRVERAPLRGCGDTFAATRGTP
ncbi:MAG TPA: acyl-protein synthetase [Planctomycetota bacterium]|nr:acyl-protein synthetase [Planctomycetota bacterium]